MKKVWILEDDPGARFVYEEVLQNAYEIEFFGTIGDLHSRARQLRDGGGGTAHLPVCLIADLQLPDGSFMRDGLGAESRALLASVPWVVVSSVQDAEVLRSCFRDGAIDYLTKPFSTDELLVKLERHVCDVHFDAERMRARFEGRLSEPLTAREAQIFCFLERRRLEEVARDDLVGAVWDDVTVCSKTLDVHLFNLRRKIEPIGLQVAFRGPDRYKLVLSR